jgi:O-antigen/teichoic acid export membrane protein
MGIHLNNLKSGVFVSTAGVFVSAFLWLFSFKAVAYWMGPEGVGLFAQLRQIAQAATVGATFGGTNSVVQGLAEVSEESARRRFRSTVSRIVGLTGIAMALGIFITAPFLSQFFLSSSAPALVATIRLMAIAVLLNVAGTYAVAVLNGYRSYPYLALAQITGPTALVTMLWGAFYFDLSLGPQLLAGSFVLCFGVTSIVGAYGVSRLSRLEAGQRPGVLSTPDSRRFIRFALSNLVAALSATLALLVIRSWIIEAQGLAFAGLFDAGWTLTFNYTTLFLTACSVIYLPLLTAAIEPESQKICMLKTAYLVLGVSILICYAMVLFKEYLINLLYSSQFQASGPVLMVLVIAVIFRGVSWVYGTMILATRNSRILLISDIVLNVSLLSTTRYVLDNSPSLEALGWAFVLPNFLYLVFVVEYARWKNQLMRRRLIWPLLIAGTMPLFYLALAPAGSQEAYLKPEYWFCAFTGLIISGAALVAYKKVAL